MGNSGSPYTIAQAFAQLERTLQLCLTTKGKNTEDSSLRVISRSSIDVEQGRHGLSSSVGEVFLPH